MIKCIYRINTPPLNSVRTLGDENTGYGRGRDFGRRNFRGGPPSEAKPVEVGKVYDVTISDISRRGDGIAKIQGFIIFVPGTKNGEQHKIKITRLSNRFANGQIVDSDIEGESQEQQE